MIKKGIIWLLFLCFLCGCEGGGGRGAADGHFFFPFYGDLTGYRDTGDHTSHLILPEKNEPMNSAYFCESCQSLLGGVSDGSYVLLDLYDLDHIQAFAVRDGANYTIRDYGVSVIWDEEKGGFLIDVMGNRD